MTKKWWALTLLLPMLALLAGYAALPYLAGYLVERWLLQQGFQNPRFSITYPGPQALQIDRLSVEKHTPDRISRLQAAPVSIHYDPWQLLQGQLQRIEIPRASLSIELTGQPSQDDPNATLPALDLAQVLPSRWLPRSPAQELLIGQLQVTMQAPEQPILALTGNIYLADQQMLTRVLAQYDNQTLGRADLTLNQDDQLQLQVVTETATVLTSHAQLTLDADTQQLAVALEHDLDLHHSLTLLARLPLLTSLPIDQLEGHYRGTSQIQATRQFTGNTQRWLASLQAKQHLTLDSQLRTPLLPDNPVNLTATGHLQYNLADGLQLQLDPASQLSLANLSVASWQINQPQLRLTTPLQLTTSPLHLAPLQIALSSTGVQANQPPLHLAVSPLKIQLSAIDLAHLGGQINLAPTTLNARYNDRALPAITLTARNQLQWPSLTSQLTLHLAQPAAQLNAAQLSAELDLQLTEPALAAHWQLSDINLPQLTQVLRPWLGSTWPRPLQVTAGEYQQQGELRWQTQHLTATIKHRISDLALQHEASQARQISLTSTTYLRGDRIDDQGQLRIGRLRSGIELANIQADYRLNHLSQPFISLDMRRFSAELLQGQLSVSPFHTLISQPAFHSELQLQGISLDALLQLERQPGLQGEGLLDGHLPLRVDQQGVWVEQGQLANRAPGIIRYQPTPDIQAMAHTNAGLELALKALSELHFQTLAAKADYNPDGALNIQTRLKGTNPTWNQGQPVDFSVNIQENLLKLLKTLRFADNLTHTLEQRYRDNQDR